MLAGAVIHGDLSTVKTILDSEDDSIKLTHGSCICLAASKGHRNIVKLLLEHGFNVNEEDALGNTAIHYSVRQDDVETTELLLQNGAEPNTKYSLLSTAARKGFGSIVKVLVDFGADVNKSDDYGQTPLHHAILQYSAMFTFLRETTKTNTCAMENVVHVLLRRGADVNAKTVNGFSPLHFAIKLKYVRILYDLLQHGADFHSLVDCNIKSPKLYQFCLKSNRSETLVRFTLKPRLTTVLHIAAESNDIASVTFLLSAGAAVDSVQYDGSTPLIVAVKCRYSKIVKVLLDYGANIEQKDKHGLSPLHLACRKGSIDVLNTLLENGADINSICNKGKVPYQYVLQLEVEMNGEHNSCGNFFDNSNHCYQQRYNDSLNMKKVLHAQLNVMYIYGFYLQDYNKEIAVKIPSIFHDVSKNNIEDFSKNVIISTNVTVYNVINETSNPFYIRNPHVIKGLDRAIAVTNAKYPGLGNAVMFLVRSARNRISLIDEGIEWFIHLNIKNDQLPTLPLDVLEVVFGFLLDKEIQIFINCCKGT